MNDSKQFPTHIVAVYGIVKNDKDEILLLKHSHENVWTFPGGQVEVGENLIDALHRETMEESGMTIAVERLYCVSSNTGTYQGYNGYNLVPTKVIFGFTCSYADGDFRDSDETTEGRWIPREQVLEHLTAPVFIEQYKAYLAFAGEVKYLAYVAKPEFIMETNLYI